MQILHVDIVRLVDQTNLHTSNNIYLIITVKSSVKLQKDGNNCILFTWYEYT